jgi:UDP-N-acetyl-D-mannosaminuronate dehydrogenase
MRNVAGHVELPEVIDVAHICYPYKEREKFMQTTLDYIKRFEHKLTIIESTVALGTTQKIYGTSKSPIVHSPLRGMYKSLQAMKKDILFWTKYVGGTTREAANAAGKHFEKLGLKVKILKSPSETELAKLFGTTYRAWMITCFQEMHRISRHFEVDIEVDFDEVVDFIEDTHRIRLDRPVMFPGVIGGHCIIPNVRLLQKSYDAESLRLILESNEKRKEEVKDEEIEKEVEKVKKRVEALEKKLAKNIVA